jgi:Flp pilus assembly protein TadG
LIADTPPSRARRASARWARRRARWRDDRGSAPIELAIVAPAVLLLVLGVIQACLVFHARNLALAAAQQGTDAARAYDAPPGAGPTRARSFLDQAAGDSLTAVTISTGADAGQVSVTVTGTAISLIPGMAFHVTQTSSGPREVVTAP